MQLKMFVLTVFSLANLPPGQGGKNSGTAKDAQDEKYNLRAFQQQRIAGLSQGSIA